MQPGCNSSIIAWMNLTEILTLFDRYERKEAEYPGMRKDVLPLLTRFVRPAPGMSFVLYSQLDETNADAAIREQVEYFSAHQQPLQWKVYSHDRPADLPERLVAHGFEFEPPEAVMILDLAEAPPTLLQPIQKDIRRVENPEQLRDVIRVEEAVWGGNFDWILPRLGSHLEVPGYLSVFIAYEADEPVCCGWVYYNLKGPFASLWGGSTLPEYRGQGFYTAVLAARVQDAIQRGYRYLTIDAGSMSQPIVARHGFQVLTYAHDRELKMPSPEG